MTFTPAAETLENTRYNVAYRAEAHAKALVVAQAADLLHVKEAIRKAAFDGGTTVTVRPRGANDGDWALNVRALVADLRAAGYAVRGGPTVLEITWAPMAPCRRVLWNWGVL